MNLNSREYQCHLFPDLFVDSDRGFRQFRAFLTRVNPAVQGRYEPQPAVCFERVLLDTARQAFAAANMKLRVRTYAGYVKCTHKIASHDRYSIANTPIDCADRAAKVKFEENIHAYHAMFVKQATSVQPKGSMFQQVEDWTRIFRSAGLVCNRYEPLYPGSSLFIIRRRGLFLNFKGQDVRTLLDLKYADPEYTRLEKVEFSWKYRDPDETYDPNVIRLMRQFFQTIHQSAWADLAVDLAKCQRDASLQIIALVQ